MTPTIANPLTYANWWFEKNGSGPIPEFEAFDRDPKYDFPKRKKASNDKWPIIVPEHPDHAPPVATTLENIMYKMIEVTWKFSEPSATAQRGNIFAGAQRFPGQQAPMGPHEPYHPQVRPTRPWMDVKMPDKSAIAQDWHLHENLERTNAVSFRADKRSPYEVIVNQKGFNPPNTRTDPFYLEEKIYGAFKDYTERRYGRSMGVDQPTFIAAVNRELTYPGAKELLFEYMLWLSIVKKEAAHIARMADNELLKGWSSTSKCMDNSINFAVMNKTPGWLYVVIVQSGYVVPLITAQSSPDWGTREAEIAQYGPIPADRIVGFTFIQTDPIEPYGPIFMRKSFREKEPKAFDFMFDMMSGGCPV